MCRSAPPPSLASNEPSISTPTPDVVPSRGSSRRRADHPRAQRLSPSAPSQPVQRREGGHVPHVVGQEDLFPQARRDLRDGPDVRPGLPPGGRPRELRQGHARRRRELLRARQLRRLAADRGGGPRQRPRPARVQTGRQDGPRFVRRHQLGGIPYRRDAGPTPGRRRGNRAASGRFREMLFRRLEEEAEADTDCECKPQCDAGYSIEDARSSTKGAPTFTVIAPTGAPFLVRARRRKQVGCSPEPFVLPEEDVCSEFFGRKTMRCVAGCALPRSRRRTPRRAALHPAPSACISRRPRRTQPPVRPQVRRR